MQHMDRMSPVWTARVLVLSLLALIAVPSAGSAQDSENQPEEKAATPETEVVAPADE
jgi:hypothetical protein